MTVLNGIGQLGAGEVELSDLCSTGGGSLENGLSEARLTSLHIWAVLSALIPAERYLATIASFLSALHPGSQSFLPTGAAAPAPLP